MLPFLLPSINDSREWLCISLKTGVKRRLLAQHDKQSHRGGAYREIEKKKREAQKLPLRPGRKKVGTRTTGKKIYYCCALGFAAV